MGKEFKGIIIPYAKMPKNGMECYLSEVKDTPNTTFTTKMVKMGFKIKWTPELYCVVTKKDCSCQKRPSWCPLKEIK